MSDLIIVENLKAVDVFKSGGADAIIEEIEAHARATTRDVESEKSRKEIRSMAYKIAQSKTAIDDLGKSLVADQKKQIKKVDAERKRIREKLDKLKDEIRAPLTEWEEREEKIKKEYQSMLVFLVNAHKMVFSTRDIESIIKEVESLVVSGVLARYESELAAAKRDALQELQVKLDEAKQRDREREELDRLRKEKEELEAEKAKIAAEEKARKEKEAAEKARREREAREAEAREQAAKEAERRAKAQAEEAARKDREDQERRHREEIQRMEREQQEREAKRLADEAARRRREREEEEKKQKAARDFEHREAVHAGVKVFLESLEGGGNLTVDGIMTSLINEEIPRVKILY